MQTTATKCETLRGFRASAVAAATAQRESRDTRQPRLSLSREGCGPVFAHESKSRAARILRLALRPPSPRGAPRVAVLLMSACLLAACAPTIHMDAPAMPTLDLQQAQCAPGTAPLNIANRVATLAPLDSRPQLPPSEQSPCPVGSGLAACFTLDQDMIRQQRFKILHDDRDYCRDAYDRARAHAAGE